MLDCPPPLPDFEPAAFEVPPGACDTHAHVVSASDEFGLVPDRSYTPPAAPEEAYLRMLAGTGMSRGVLVQISVYGTDNRYLLRTLRRHPRRLRGVVVIDPDVDDDALAAMHAAGVRGARLNVLFGGGVGFEQMERVSSRIADHGWHLQLLMDVRDLPELSSRLRRLPVPIVVDHMGHTDATRTTEQPGFRELLRLLDRENVWVKLSGAYRIDPEAPDYPHAASFARTLLRQAPERMLYGSDWPHVAVPHAMPDTGHLRNLLGEWSGDSRLLEKVLVENPAVLYGFDADDTTDPPGRDAG